MIDSPNLTRITEDLDDFDAVIIEYEFILKDFSPFEKRFLKRLKQLKLNQLPLLVGLNLSLQTNLTVVSIMQCSLSSIASFAELLCVTELDVRGNHIESMAPIQNLSKLKILNLSNNNL